MLACFVALGSFTGCDKELEYDVPTAPPQLVVNSVFTQDSLWEIEVSNSANPGQGSTIQYLTDAEIKLWQNDKEVKDIVPKQETIIKMVGGEPQDFVRHYYASESTEIEEGQEYRIEVRHPDYKMASSRAILPYPADISWRGLANPNEVIDIDGKAFRKLTFNLKNNSPNEGYFAIQLLYGDGTEIHKIEFFASDPIFNENQIFDEGDRTTEQGKIYDTNRGIFFSSQAFGGQQHSFDIFVETQYLDPAGTFEVRILTFSEELYDYSIALQRQQNSSGNPFAEPVQVYSNINNGYGIFGGYALSVLPYVH